MTKSEQRLAKTKEQIDKRKKKLTDFQEQLKQLEIKEKEEERAAILETLESENITLDDIKEYLQTITLLKFKGIGFDTLTEILNSISQDDPLLQASDETVKEGDDIAAEEKE